MVGLVANKVSLWVIPLFVLCAFLPLSDTRSGGRQKVQTPYQTSVGKYTLRRIQLVFFNNKWYTVNLYAITPTEPRESSRKGKVSRKNMIPSKVRVEVGVGIVKSEILEYPKNYFEGKLRYLLKMQNKSDARNKKA